MRNNLKIMTEEVEKELVPIYEEIDRIGFKNSQKVLEAFQKCDLQESHLYSSTGYGIDEPGRNKIEEIYATIFKAEDALDTIGFRNTCISSNFIRTFKTK